MTTHERAEQIRRWLRDHEPNDEEFERYLTSQLDKAVKEDRESWSMQKEYEKGFSSARKKAAMICDDHWSSPNGEIAERILAMIAKEE